MLVVLSLSETLRVGKSMKEVESAGGGQEVEEKREGNSDDRHSQLA